VIKASLKNMFLGVVRNLYRKSKMKMRGFEEEGAF